LLNFAFGRNDVAELKRAIYKLRDVSINACIGLGKEQSRSLACGRTNIVGVKYRRDSVVSVDNLQYLRGAAYKLLLD
jgi:hypothetical protein